MRMDGVEGSNGGDLMQGGMLRNQMNPNPGLGGYQMSYQGKGASFSKSTENVLFMLHLCTILSCTIARSQLWHEWRNEHHLSRTSAF